MSDEIKTAAARVAKEIAAHRTNIIESAFIDDASILIERAIEEVCAEAYDKARSAEADAGTLRAALDDAREKLEAYEQRAAKRRADTEELNARLKEEHAKKEAKDKAPGKKVYLATAHREADFYVYADNADAAEEIAEEHASDVLDGEFDSPRVTVAPVDPRTTADDIPYSAEGDNEDEKTVAELLAEQAEADKAEAARRDFEARQIKFPWAGGAS